MIVADIRRDTHRAGYRSVSSGLFDGQPMQLLMRWLPPEYCKVLAFVLGKLDLPIGCWVLFLRTIFPILKVRSNTQWKMFDNIYPQVAGKLLLSLSLDSPKLFFSFSFMAY